MFLKLSNLKVLCLQRAHSPMANTYSIAVSTNVFTHPSAEVSELNSGKESTQGQNPLIWPQIELHIYRVRVHLAICSTMSNKFMSDRSLKLLKCC